MNAAKLFKKHKIPGKFISDVEAWKMASKAQKAGTFGKKKK